MSNHELIFCHPHVASGAPCIVGTRITVREIQREYERLISARAVVEAFEERLTMAEVQAALNYTLTDVKHRWNTGSVEILEGEHVMYVTRDGVVQIPLADVPVAISAMTAAFEEWQQLGKEIDVD